MYSTPGTSHSSFSMGLVTRSSTSSAEAPGISTKTSIIGTMICGSSSRGSFQIEKTPTASEATMISGVSFELMKAWASLPAIPSFARRLHGRTSTGEPSIRSSGTGRHDPLPDFESGKHLDHPFARSSERHQPSARLAAARSTYTDRTCPRVTTALSGTTTAGSSPMVNRARPNRPERRFGRLGRLIRTRNAREEASTAGTISETRAGIVSPSASSSTSTSSPLWMLASL